MTVMETTRTTANTRNPNDPRYWLDGALSTQMAADAAGVTYRQLDHWVRLGAIRPARDANGSGSARRWDPSQIRLIRAFGALRDLGCPVDVAALGVNQLALLPEDQWTGTHIFEGRILNLDHLRG